jgi:hypothetical protein
VSTSGHAIASFYFYASFLLAVGYAVWNFVVFEEIVSVSMPLTASLGLNIPALLEVQCGAATNVTLLVNYSGSSSSASCFLWPNATSFFKDVNTVSTNYANSSVWFASAALSAGSVARFPAPWCYAFQQDVVMFNARWPTLAGIALAFDRIPWGSSCQITIRAAVSPPSGSPSSVSFTTTDSFQAVQTLSLEGGVVKTFFAAYTAVKIVQDKMRLSSATLDAYYFELDGVRSINNVEWGKPGADSSSVVSLRLTEVSRSIAKEDSRTVFTFLGFFGQVWGLVGKAMLVLGPLLVILCPRDFLADAKAGHVDGHTKFLLDDAWKPGTIAGFGLTLFQRVQALKKES